MKKCDLAKSIHRLGALTILGTLFTISDQAFATTEASTENSRLSEKNHERAGSNREKRSGRDNDRFNQEHRQFEREDHSGWNDHRYDRDNRFDYDHFDRDMGRREYYHRDHRDHHFDREFPYMYEQHPHRHHDHGDYYRDRDAYHHHPHDEYMNRDMYRERSRVYDRNHGPSQVDEEVVKDIQYALSPGIFSKGYEQVKGSVRNGIVTLTGTVQSQKDKETVENTVRDVKGVRRVENNVRVLEMDSEKRPSNKEAAHSEVKKDHDRVTDEQIEHKVRDALNPGMFTKGYDQVTAEVQNNSVTLSGAVQTQGDKEKLERAIRNIHGVREVENNVKILTTGSSETSSKNENRTHEVVPDDQLAKNIRYELSGGLFTKGYEQIQVETKDGNATLSGAVQTLKDKEAVEKIVRNVRGVRNITTEIKVIE